MYEVSGGFGVKDADNTWFHEGQYVSVECYASKYNFESVRWIREDNKSRGYNGILAYDFCIYIYIIFST